MKFVKNFSQNKCHPFTGILCSIDYALSQVGKNWQRTTEIVIVAWAVLVCYQQCEYQNCYFLISNLLYIYYFKEGSKYIQKHLMNFDKNRVVRSASISFFGYLLRQMDMSKPNGVHLKHFIASLNLKTFKTSQYIMSELFITL